MGYTVSLFRRPEDPIYKLYNEPVCRKLDFSILDNDYDIRRRRLSVFQPHQRRSSPRRFKPRPQPRKDSKPRRRHPLIDDSAIESDGEGGDISSIATTPERPSPPPRKPNKVVVKFRSIPRPPSPKPLPVKRTIVKFEKTCVDYLWYNLLLRLLLFNTRSIRCANLVSCALGTLLYSLLQCTCLNQQCTRLQQGQKHLTV